MSRISKVVFLAVVTSGAVIACSDREEPTPISAPTPAPTEDTSDEAALDRARSLAKRVGGGLKARLLDAMTEGGPASAITVCADEAMALTRAAVGEDESAGRASTKLRNPDNDGPPWVRAWLFEQGETASDASPLARVEDGRARVILPIAVEGVCLSCHGDETALTPEVRAVLNKHYPNDHATDYAEDDLRGALWADVPAR